MEKKSAKQAGGPPAGVMTRAGAAAASKGGGGAGAGSGPAGGDDGKRRKVEEGPVPVSTNVGTGAIQWQRCLGRLVQDSRGRGVRGPGAGLTSGLHFGLRPHCRTHRLLHAEGNRQQNLRLHPPTHQSPPTTRMMIQRATTSRRRTMCWMRLVSLLER